MLIYSANGELGDALVERIRMMMKEVEVGDEYVGKVVKTTTFGAFIELAKGTDGLLHISNVSPGERVETVEDVLNRGDEVSVRVVEVDRERGRIGLRLADDPDIAGKSVEELAGVGTGGGGGGGAWSRGRRDAVPRATAATAALAAARVTVAAGAPAARAMGATAADLHTAAAHAEHRTDDARLRAEDRHRKDPERPLCGARVLDLERARPPSGEDEAGISHLLEHMLFRGTEHFGSEEIDQIFDAMGAEINAGTDKEATSLYTRVLDGHLERAFEVMSEMIWQPRFGELEAEREVVLEEIAMYEDDPQDLVFDLLGRAVFGSHPLGRPVIGRAEVVAATTREQLAAFHDRRYRPRDDRDRRRRVGRPRRAGRAGRSLAGPRGRAGRGALRRTAGAGIARRRPSRTSRRGWSSCRRTPSSTTCASAGTGWRARTSAASPCGCSKGSSAAPPPRACSRRSASAAAWPTRSSRSRTCTPTRARWGCTSAPAPTTCARRCRSWPTELQRLVEDPASEQELVRSRENLKGRVVLGMESTGARMSRLGTSLLHGMPILGVDEMLARIDAVELDDLRELAGELFAPEHMSAVGIGPERERMLEALEPLGLEARAAANGADAGKARRRRMIRVVVSGAEGRMGRTVCEAVTGAEDMELAGRADPLLGTTVEELLGGADVVVDFTTPDVALQNALACVRAGVHVVIGTTGFDPAPLVEARPEDPRAPRQRPDRSQLRDRGGADDALRRRGRPLHGRRRRSSSCTTTPSSTPPAAPRPSPPGGWRKPAASPSRRSTPCACRAWWPTRR